MVAVNIQRQHFPSDLRQNPLFLSLALFFSSLFSPSFPPPPLCHPFFASLMSSSPLALPSFPFFFSVLFFPISFLLPHPLFYLPFSSLAFPFSLSSLCFILLVSSSFSPPLSFFVSPFNHYFSFPPLPFPPFSTCHLFAEG